MSVTLRKILVPIAYFDSCQTALELGGVLARALGSSLTILHVVRPSNRTLLGARVASRKLAEWGIEPPPFKLLRRAELRLQELGLFQLDDEGEPVEVHSLKALAEGLYEVHLRGIADQDVRFRLREGEPVREILQESEDPEYDLIVTGTRGHRGIHRFWVGSVAQSVAQHAPCSVLVAKNLAPDQSLLVGVSGRETALEAVRQAGLLAMARGTPLTLLAVAQGEEARGEAERSLEGAWETLSAEGIDVQVETRLRTGDPADVLVEEAGEKAIIALGRFKRSRVKEFFLGDVSLEILESSQGPVLLAATPRPIREDESAIAASDLSHSGDEPRSTS